ncbi:Hypothetical protein OINT_1001008 [Brucella intermedia LMG 3301]|uniref:Uncharacterized protein n=1 Tax=Brucella intermedia LMG 3301 TaxID=641118 RepID=C4WHG9_9HYPH|nr:Hypothetical protein OINT_1001008 [Brucella intermedia LMG 3301]
MKQFKLRHSTAVSDEENCRVACLILQRIAGKTGSAKHLQ